MATIVLIRTFFTAHGETVAGREGEGREEEKGVGRREEGGREGRSTFTEGYIACDDKGLSHKTNFSLCKYVDKCTKYSVSLHLM